MQSGRRSVDALLVGGGVASVRCARTLRREGFTGSILLVGEELSPPYNRPPLSKELLRADLPDELLMAEPASWYERRGIELAAGVAVTTLEPDPGRALLSDGSSVSFDRCLLATGAEPVSLPVPGVEHAFLLRTLADARRLRAAASSAESGSRVVVVGGGFIGIEVASGLAAMGLRPTLVERSNALWGGSLGAAASAWGLERLTAAGIQVRLNASVTRLDEHGVWVGQELIGAAVVVAGVGVRPRVGLAVKAGLAVDDGIITDTDQRTSHRRVWAAGDVARWSERRVEHWHAARESGERAARSMLGLDGAPVPVPWVFSEVGGVPVDIVGGESAWDEERWLVHDRLVAQLASGRVVGLVSIDSAMPATQMRRAVAEGLAAEELVRPSAPD